MVKNPLASARGTREVGLIPGSGRSPGGRNGKPLSCLENPMDRGASPCGHKLSDTTEHTVSIKKKNSVFNNFKEV